MYKKLTIIVQAIIILNIFIGTVHSIQFIKLIEGHTYYIETNDELKYSPYLNLYSIGIFNIKKYLIKIDSYYECTIKSRKNRNTNIYNFNTSISFFKSFNFRNKYIQYLIFGSKLGYSIEKMNFYLRNSDAAIENKNSTIESSYYAGIQLLNDLLIYIDYGINFNRLNNFLFNVKYNYNEKFTVYFSLYYNKFKYLINYNNFVKNEQFTINSSYSYKLKRLAFSYYIYPLKFYLSGQLSNIHDDDIDKNFDLKLYNSKQNITLKTEFNIKNYISLCPLFIYNNYNGWPETDYSQIFIYYENRKTAAMMFKAKNIGLGSQFILFKKYITSYLFYNFISDGKASFYPNSILSNIVNKKVDFHNHVKIHIINCLFPIISNKKRIKVEIGADFFILYFKELNFNEYLYSFLNIISDFGFFNDSNIIGEFQFAKIAFARLKFGIEFKTSKMRYSVNFKQIIPLDVDYKDRNTINNGSGGNTTKSENKSKKLKYWVGTQLYINIFFH